LPDQAVSVLDGNNFVVSDSHGDIDDAARFPPHGFFAEDTRFVSRWRLSVQGQPTDILSHAHVDYFVAQFFLVSPSESFHAAPPLGIIRQRLLGDVWMEDLVIVNHRDEHTAVAIDLEVGTDFADLFEVKDEEIRPRDIRVERRARELVLGYRNGDFVRETRVAVSDEATIEDGAIRLDLWLAPREEHRVSFVVTPHSHQHDRSLSARRRAGSWSELRRERLDELAAWVAQAPRLETDNDTLGHVYQRSLADLAALRFYPTSRSRTSACRPRGCPGS
jgi:hypothetical protein